MRNYVTFMIGALLIATGCGSSDTSSPGEGANFTSQTGPELFQTYTNHLYVPNGVNGSSSWYKTATVDCDKGGTVSSKDDTQTDSETYAHEKTTLTYNNCVDSDGNTYNGTMYSEYDVTTKPDHLSIHLVQNMSIGGELGLAASCDVTNESDADKNLTVSGQCTYHDNLGKQVVATSEMIKSVIKN